MRATLIKANGRQKSVTPINGTDFSLEELQGFVGGLIEILSLDNGQIMILNDEGALDSLPVNYGATLYASKNLGRICPLVGDVLLCDDEMVK